jgi:hypothetical protein
MPNIYNEIGSNFTHFQSIVNIVQYEIIFYEIQQTDEPGLIQWVAFACFKKSKN